VVDSAEAPLACATWLQPPPHLRWPSRLTQHRFGPDAPCSLHTLFGWSEESGAEPRTETDALQPFAQEWVRCAQVLALRLA